MTEHDRGIRQAIWEGFRFGFKVTAWIVGPLAGLYLLALIKGMLDGRRHGHILDALEVGFVLAGLASATVFVMLIGGVVGAVVRGLFATMDALLNARAKRP